VQGEGFKGIAAAGLEEKQDGVKGQQQEFRERRRKL
jgi:hypothetical protein